MNLGFLPNRQKAENIRRIDGKFANIVVSIEEVGFIVPIICQRQ